MGALSARSRLGGGGGGCYGAFPGPLSSPSTDEPSVRVTVSIGIRLSEELVVNSAPEKMKLVTDGANESINLWSSCESKGHQAVMDGQSRDTRKRTSKPRATVKYVSSR